MAGTFTTDEKINFALKSLLQLTTGFGNRLMTSESVALPSIYPISIKKQNIIKNGEGDLGSDFVDESQPYTIVEQYKIIDPVTNKVSGKKIVDVLGDKQFAGNITFGDSPKLGRIYDGNPENWIRAAVYKHWYAEFDATNNPTGRRYPIDPMGRGVENLYKGIRLAYTKAEPGTVVKEETDYDLSGGALNVDITGGVVGDAVVVSPVSPVGDTGSGLEVSVSVWNTTTLESIIVTKQGSGYAVGDVITIQPPEYVDGKAGFNSFTYTIVDADLDGNSFRLKSPELNLNLMVPHISLYLHLPLTQFAVDLGTDADTVSFTRNDQLTKNMLGPEVGFKLQLLLHPDKLAATPALFTTEVANGVLNANEFISNPSFGLITLFTNSDERFAKGNKVPRMSFCRYIGELVDFNSGGGSSVTVGITNVDAPGAEGDLFYDIDDTKLQINTNGTSAGWVDVGGAWTKKGTTDDVYYNNGNVGIGIDSPGAKLEIQDTVPCIRLTDDRYEAGKFSTELEMGKIEWYSRDGSATNPVLNMAHPFNIAKISVINKPNSGALPDCRIGFFTGEDGNVNEKMSIFSNGNVGIGTPLSGYKLDVDGDINFTGSLTYKGVTYPAAGTSGGGAWEKNSTDVYYNTGNVGIGTTTPGGKLDISGGHLMIADKTNAKETGMVELYTDDNKAGCLLGTYNMEESLVNFINNVTQAVSQGTVSNSSNTWLGFNSTNLIYKSTTSTVGFECTVGTTPSNSSSYVYCGLRTADDLDRSIGGQAPQSNITYAFYSVASTPPNASIYVYYKGQQQGSAKQLIYGYDGVSKKYEMRVDKDTGIVSLYYNEVSTPIHVFPIALTSSNYPIRVMGSIYRGSISNCKVVTPGYTPLSVHNERAINLSAESINFYTHGASTTNHGYNALDDINTDTNNSWPILSITDSCLRFNASGSTDMIILDNGNVGIGTTSPGGKLEVEYGENIAKADIIGIKKWGNDSGSIIYNMIQLGTESHHPNTGRINVFSDGVEKVKISGSGDTYFNGGNVGIGRTPTGFYKLEVGGNITVAGNINFTGRLMRFGEDYDGGGAWAQSRTTDDVYYNTGNVGIGTSSPYAKLDVEGDTLIQGDIHIGTVPPYDSTPGGTQAARWLYFDNIDENGYYGNGAHTIGGIIFRANENSDYILGTLPNYENYCKIDGYASTGGGGTLRGDIKFWTRNAGGGAGDGSPMYERMRIRYDGNVGIGVVAPGYKLEVAGKIKASISIEAGKATNNASYLGTAAISGTPHGSDWASFSYYTHVTASGYSLMQNAAGRTLLNCESGQTIEFRVANSSKMAIDQFGRVGIGTTTPEYKLDVRGSVRLGDGLATEQDLVFVSKNGNWQVGTNNSGNGTNSNQFYFYESTGGNYMLTIQKGTGNVGIGTYLPTQKLHVVGVVKSNGYIVDDELNINSNQIYKTSSQPMYMQYSGGGDLRLCDGGGYVGIGMDKVNNSTAGPVANLQVRGEGRFDGYGRSSHINYKGGEKKPGNLENTYIRAGTSSGKVLIQETGGNVDMCKSGQGVVFINGSGSVSWDGYWTRFVMDPFVEIDWHAGSSSIGCCVTSGLVANWYGAESDRRIKKNIEDIDDGDALKILRQIPVRYYNYKDIVTKGTQKVAGFIAQEVKEVFPMAVSINPSPKPIPNIYKRITNEVWEEIPDSGEDIYDGENKWVLKKFDLIDSSGVILPPDISEGESYKFVVDASGTITDETILCDSSGNFIFKKKYKHLYLYGIVINDFHIVDKNKIFAIGFSATQEIDRIQQAEKTKLEEQTTKLEEQTTKLEAAKIKINTLESENTALKSRLDAIEARLTSAGIN